MRYFIEDKEIDLSQYCKTYNKGFYNEIRGVEKCTLILNDDKKEKKLRQLRKKIFEEAFDIYKLNYDYGLEEPETEEEHQEIVAWYNNMLDIEKTENAIENIPKRIKKYID